MPKIDTPYMEGKQAYRDGEVVNPYPEGTQQYTDWNTGWNYAHYMDPDEQRKLDRLTQWREEN